MQYSDFGNKYLSNVVILELMDDMAKALSSGDKIMLGGGNPSKIPAVQKVFIDLFKKTIQNSKSLNSILFDYGNPQGDHLFIQAFCKFINDYMGWNISEKNIALTTGSQQAYFFLLNLFSGKYGSTKKQILLPMLPEYVGYVDAPLKPDSFVGLKPAIDKIDEHFFKYRVNFDKLSYKSNYGAICVSSPNNPSGNTMDIEDLNILVKMANDNNIPLFLDNAYGYPFPQLQFSRSNIQSLKWSDNLVLTLSLSKLGLPGLRTGIVIANESIIKKLSTYIAINNLSVSTLGTQIVRPLIENKEIINISKNLIKPYYRKKQLQVLKIIKEKFKNINYHIHKPDGTMFLWVWFPGLKISDKNLYRKLKEAGVICVPGSYFFYGLDQKWLHARQCLRINYTQKIEDIIKGFEIIAVIVGKYS